MTAPSLSDSTVVVLAGGGPVGGPDCAGLPKPLLPVDGKPVIEHNLKWLRAAGLRRAIVALGYLGKLVRTVCGDGSQWDMELTYCEEASPLGTMGPLRLIDPLRLGSDFLVLNAGILTDLDLAALSAAHRAGGELVTVAVTGRSARIDLGVLECDGWRLVGFQEKPSFGFTVSMGVYCMRREVLDFIPRGMVFGFDDLMRTLLARGRAVRVFEHRGQWRDVSRPERNGRDTGEGA